MTKIAIPIVSGNLNNHFGHTQEFYVYEIENNLITSETVLTPPPHEPGAYPKWLAGMGVTDVIAGGLGQRAIVLFNQNKINVFVGVPVKSPKELVQDYMSGTLETSDNCCDH
jgi:predicted Fe-Mo cluster-binding NifX family protein